MYNNRYRQIIQNRNNSPVILYLMEEVMELKKAEQIKTTLFGLNKDGSTQQWSVYVREIKLDLVEIIVEYGKKGGKIQRKITEITKGKNIGKANETTALEQAILEATSKWEKQVRLGYKENEDDLVNDPVLTPMLAQDGAKKPHLIKYPCYVQPKLDGVRCLVEFKDNGEITFTSRGNKQYPQHEHLVSQLEQLKQVCPELKYLDGEIYIHGMQLQDIVSFVKKPQDGSEKLDFIIFDLPLLDKTFEERLEMLYKVENICGDVCDFLLPNIHTIDTWLINSESVMFNFLEDYTENGYEGLIARNVKGLYKFSQRSNDLIKVKKFQDTEVKVIDAERDKNDEGILICQDREGIIVKCKMKGDHEYRSYKNMLTLVGKYITIKYQARTKDNSYQFPVGMAVRELDDNWNPLY